MMIGRIYKITSSQTNAVYIGSTTESIRERLSKHKSNYKRFQDGKYCNVSSFEIIQYADAVIELIEEQEFKDKQDMLFRERYYIEMHECVNKVIPIRTNEETKERKKISDKKYKDKNKDNEEKKEIKNAYDYKRIECECGCSYFQKHRQRHMRTQKHMNHERAININITFNMTINDSEVKIITNGNENI